MFRGCSSKCSSSPGDAETKKPYKCAKVKHAVLLCLVLVAFIGLADMAGQAYAGFLFCRKCNRNAIENMCNWTGPGVLLDGTQTSSCEMNQAKLYRIEFGGVGVFTEKCTGVVSGNHVGAGAGSFCTDTGPSTGCR